MGEIAAITNESWALAEQSGLFLFIEKELLKVYKGMHKLKVCKREVFLLLLLLVALLFIIPLSAHAEGPPEKVDITPFASLLLEWAKWLGMLSILILGGIAVVRGVEIAFSGTAPNRAEISQKVLLLVIGCVISFGAWFLIALLKGVFG